MLHLTQSALSLQFFEASSQMEVMVIFSFLVMIAAMFLKWAAVSEFHRERFPGYGHIKIHHKLSWMTWNESQQYRREKTSYFRRKGTLTYNRILTAVFIFGAVGFVVFGYLADAQHPKQKQVRVSWGAAHEVAVFPPSSFRAGRWRRAQ